VLFSLFNNIFWAFNGVVLIPFFFFFFSNREMGTKFRINSKLQAVRDWHDWPAKCDSMLLIGVSLHGFGNWRAIKEDDQLDLKNRIFEGEKGQDGKDIIPKFPHITRRAEYLLKVIREEEKERNQKSLKIKLPLFSGKKKQETTPSDDDFESEEEHKRKKAEKRKKSENSVHKSSSNNSPEIPKKEKKHSHSHHHSKTSEDQELLEDKDFEECEKLMEPVKVCK